MLVEVVAFCSENTALMLLARELLLLILLVRFRNRCCVSEYVELLLGEVERVNVPLMLLDSVVVDALDKSTFLIDC